jgi:predicted MFS family arabinose efflux permease
MNDLTPDLPPDLSHDLGPPASMRTAVTALFALGGFIVASWAVRIPDVSTQVGAGHAALGAALLCVSLGALATMRVTGSLCERLGPGLVSTVAAVLLCVTVVIPGLVHTVAGLGAVLIAFGAATGTLNVAMNSVGVRLEARAGRPLLPSLHAAFSFGGLGGSVVGGLAASAITPAPHLLAVACTGLLCVSALSRRLVASDTHLRPLLPPDDDHDPDQGPVRPLGAIRSQVVMLGAIAGCTAYGEGALSDWAALHLSADLHATPVLAAAGYAAFSLAMACGRLGGPALLDALGDTRLLVAGALLGASGMLLTALAPDLPASLIGLVLVGLGLANVFPVAIARAGALAGSRGVGLASTVGYSGLLLGPALIGFLAGRVGLPTALTTVSALALVAAGLSLRVAGDQRVRLVFLPWSQGEVRARLTTSLGQVGTVVSDASRRHAGSLAALTPAAMADGSGSRTGSPASPLRDLDWVLGHRR